MCPCLFRSRRATRRIFPLTVSHHILYPLSRCQLYAVDIRPEGETIYTGGFMGIEILGFVVAICGIAVLANWVDRLR